MTIFKSLLKAINDHVQTKEEKAKMLDPVLPVFINKLIGSLNSPSGHYSSFELKTEILKGPKFLLNLNSVSIIAFMLLQF